MWRHSMLVLAAGLLLQCSMTLNAAEREQFSGPQAGEALPPLNVLMAKGQSDVETVDLIAMADGKPLILVFVHNVTRPSGALSRTLTNYAEMRRDDGLFTAVIYLTDDPSKGPRGGRGRRDARSIIAAVSPDGKEGPGSYGLNRNMEITVLVGHEGKVSANFALVQPSVTDAPKVISSIVELIGGRVPTKSEIEFLMMNQFAAPKHRANGAAPSDPVLRQKLCDVLYAIMKTDTLDSSVKAVEDYVADNARRQTQLGDAARGLLHARYPGSDAIDAGSPVGGQLQQWSEKFKSKDTESRRDS